MTPEEFARVPLSAVIRAALDDLARVEADPRYEVYMEVWHDEIVPGRCYVCLAGAVMAGTLGVPLKQKAGAISEAMAIYAREGTPDDVVSGVHARLWALNLVRSGYTSAALAWIDATPPEDAKWPAVTPYDVDHAAFHRDLLAVAAAPRREGAVTSALPNPISRIRRLGQIGGRLYVAAVWLYYEALSPFMAWHPGDIHELHRLRRETALVIFTRWRPIPGAADQKGAKSMLGRLKDKLTGASKRLSGKTDLLEGIAAACVLVAAADGTIDDSEVDTMLKALCAHEQISAAFGQSQIEACVDKMLARAKQGRAGRLGLLREVEDVKAKSSQDDAEMLLMIAIDVADAAGGIEAAERRVIMDIGSRLGLSAARYLDG